jgi:hypothetical protein
VPTVSNGGCRPSFEVFHCEGIKIDKVFSYQTDKKYYQKNHVGWINMQLTEEQTMSFTMRGDNKIIFKHGGKTTICRIMFNTAFI